MPFNAIHEYDANTASNNIDIGGANIAEGCAPSGINNALRELAKQIRRAVANQGSDIASAATTDIGASTGQYVRVTGTTSITGLGTINAGATRWVEFTGALTLTHNATSLKLPGSANIVTAGGDVACFVSLGAGNWKCLSYVKADGSPLAGAFTGVLASTDAGAGQGPDFVADRNSASPAASDVIGAVVFRGRDSGANATDYAKLRAVIADPTNASEDGQAILSAQIGGTETDILKIGPGVQIGSPTGGDKGAGTLNLDATLYVDGNPVAGPVYIIVDEKALGTNGGGATSGSFQKVTLNTERLDQIGITTTSSTMSLPAGTYRVRWTCPAYNCDNFATRLQDTTNAATLVTGSNADAPAGQHGLSVGFGAFALVSAANVELQRRVTTTNATDGGGQATSFGTEVYAQVYLEKVA